jgi:catechol 2,3-dioxygenase-like lactoylglutathione lyase family enzyme
MSIELNHTIVPAHDPTVSAQFLARVLGLTVDPPVAHFTPVTLANSVTLDFDQHDNFESHHAAFARIQNGGVPFYADPACQRAGQIYRGHGHRGTYFRDPDGHLMEILTPAA